MTHAFAVDFVSISLTTLIALSTRNGTHYAHDCYGPGMMTLQRSSCFAHFSVMTFDVFFRLFVGHRTWHCLPASCRLYLSRNSLFCRQYPLCHKTTHISFVRYKAAVFVHRYFALHRLRPRSSFDLILHIRIALPQFF